MDSTSTRITYTAIQKRAKQDALDRMPAMPMRDSAMDWESYIVNLEAIDAYEIAHESAEWDWVIYHGAAMELCQQVPTSVLHDAESTWDEYDMPKPAGLYELASELAYFIVVREIVDAIEQCRDDLLELANNKLDQMESA
jgi:hypothetical protein